MNTFWPLFAFLAPLAAWFGYDGFVNPNTKSQALLFNQIGAFLLGLPAILLGWLAFRPEPSVGEGAPASSKNAPGIAQAECINEMKVSGWNWGAFFLAPFWGVGHRVYFGLLALLPVVGIAFAIILGVKGNEWAWQRKAPTSIAQFRRVQAMWTYVAVGLFFVVIALNVVAIVTHGAG
jgi:hypothetical protein